MEQFFCRLFWMMLLHEPLKTFHSTLLVSIYPSPFCFSSEGEVYDVCVCVHHGAHDVHDGADDVHGAYVDDDDDGDDDDDDDDDDDEPKTKKNKTNSQNPKTWCLHFRAFTSL